MRNFGETVSEMWRGYPDKINICEGLRKNGVH